MPTTFSTERRSLLKRVAELSHSGLSIHEQERALHVSHSRLMEWRKQAGQAGYEVRKASQTAGWTRAKEISMEAGRLAVLDTTPGCAICGLRGEHECIKGNAQDRRPWL